MPSGRKEAPCTCMLEDGRRLEVYPTIGFRVRGRDMDRP